MNPASSVHLTAPASEPTREWTKGDYVLHKESETHYVLYGPEAEQDTPFGWLQLFGIDGTWTCEWDSVGDVLVTHLRK